MPIFDKLVYALTPIILIVFLAHFIGTLVFWCGWKSDEYPGLVGFIKYYFHAWREAIIYAKETYEEGTTKKEDEKNG